MIKITILHFSYNIIYKFPLTSSSDSTYADYFSNSHKREKKLFLNSEYFSIINPGLSFVWKNLESFFYFYWKEKSDDDREERMKKKNASNTFQ